MFLEVLQHNRWRRSDKGHICMKIVAFVDALKRVPEEDEGHLAQVVLDLSVGLSEG